MAMKGYIMKNLRKYALAAALVIPSVFGLGAKNSEAAKISINEDLASGVNVRTEASEGDNVIGVINNSENTYDIIGEEGSWLKINFDGKDGYVVSKWFNILDETKLVSDANFRDADNLDSNIIEVLKAGTEVEVLDTANNGYVKVKVNDKEGYVYNNLLESFRKAREEKAAANNQKQTSNNQKTQSGQVSGQNYQATQTYSQPQPAQQQAQSSSQGSSSWAKEWIAQRESGGSYTAYNAAGGYYGRYQLNPSLVSYGASPAEQEAAADNYVADRKSVV